MENRAQTDCFNLFPEDWRSHGYTHEARDERFGSELANDVHPMFSYELDEMPPRARTKARWGKLTLEEYRLLDQPLRLATQWLENTASSDAICSIVYGERYTPADNPRFEGVQVPEFRRHDLPFIMMSKKAGEVLERLGNSIMFRATERDGSADMRPGVHARTWPSTRYYPEGIAITDRPEKKGVAGIIRLHPDYLTMLKGLLEDPEEKECQILKLYFEIAVTICHELMHTLDFALKSDLLKAYMANGDNLEITGFNEPFYEGQRVAEIGFFWENHVFGGAFNQSLPEPADAIFLGEWPSLLFREKASQPERAPPKKVCFRWLVSWYYIKNSLTQEFWDKIRLRHPRDLLALRVRKTIAQKIELGQIESDHDEDDYDESWDHTDPVNVPPSCGHPDRIPWYEIDPSAGARLANETYEERNERLGVERWLADTLECLN